MSGNLIEKSGHGRSVSAALTFLWRFVAILALLFGMLYADDRVWNQFVAQRLTEVFAMGVALNMQLMGLDAVREANSVTFREHSFAIVADCIGLDVYALYIAAILATPVAFVHKLKGLAIGVPILVVVNHARIVSIITLGAISANWIDAGHLYVWPAVLMMLSIGLWLSWIRSIKDDPRLLD